MKYFELKTLPATEDFEELSYRDFLLYALRQQSVEKMDMGQVEAGCNLIRRLRESPGWGVIQMTDDEYKIALAQVDGLGWHVLRESIVTFYRDLRGADATPPSEEVPGERQRAAGEGLPAN